MTFTTALDAWRGRAELAEREADELVDVNATLDALLSILLQRHATPPADLRAEIEAAIGRARLAEADHQSNLYRRQQ